jgi:hypothetical protein
MIGKVFGRTTNKKQQRPYRCPYTYRISAQGEGVFWEPCKEYCAAHKPFKCYRWKRCLIHDEFLKQETSPGLEGPQKQEYKYITEGKMMRYRPFKTAPYMENEGGNQREQFL